MRESKLNMHVYSNQEYEIKQNEQAKAQIHKPVMLKPFMSESKVIKNYIYYDEPFCII